MADAVELTVRQKAEEIAHDLNGTCQSLTTALEGREWDGLDTNDEFTAVLDSLVFECEGCSWWFEVSEMCPEHDAWKCEDCCPACEDSV